MSLRKGYLFRFLSGHGGDFFITCASKCSRSFIGSWDNQEQVIQRMNEFVTTKKMPGNNIGKKLIDGTWEDYKKSIDAELEPLLQQAMFESGLQKDLYVSFCSHYGQNTVDIKPHLEDHLGIPIQEINLTPTTQQSWDWIDYHYDCKHKEHAPEDGIDPIDLFLNNEKEFDFLVQRLGEDINWEWVNIVKRYFRDVKVKPFLRDGT